MNCFFPHQRSFITVIILLSAALFVAGQDNAPTPSRTITSQDFQTKRPAMFQSARKNKVPKKTITPVTNQKRRKNIAVITNAGRRYKHTRRTNNQKTAVLAAASNAPPSKKNTNPAPPKKQIENDASEEIGVTFWRLRPVKKEEADAPTFNVNVGDGSEKWTAERVRSTTKFKPNDCVRFTIESLRSGFLYIINREVYADGSTGEAELIYPEIRGRTRRDNRVTAGSLIEIPATDEVTPYFRIKPKSDDYAGEEVIVIISPTRLAGFSVSAENQSIKRAALQKWFDDWASVTDVYDAEDGEGIAYTRTEAEAVATRALTQEEPLPQTIYRFQSKVGKPLMVSFQMQIKK